jgi:tartrate/fumarate subfamily iron-sulfur-dependent hydro-lyase beta chain
MSSVVRLHTPIPEGAARALRVGQEVMLSGTVITARDEAHRYLAKRDEGDGMPFDLAGGVIYHCGPIMRREGDGWSVVSAGPTTSARMEIYEPLVVARYGPRAILGKGGMGQATAEALAEEGAVYLTAASGAGALLGKCVTKVAGVWKLDEFGEPEAMWRLEVADFPAIVAMDTVGGNIYSDVLAKSSARLVELRRKYEVR